MAIQNHPALYTGGSERFNSQPVVNIYAQTLARKQAREDALDEYERSRINRINEAGLRDQDREGLDNKVLELKGYYNQNKNAIRKGNNKESYEYEKMFRDNLNYISESKDRAARSNAVMKYREERLKKGRGMPEGFLEEYELHELPIGGKKYDQEGKETPSKAIDISKYALQEQPNYDQQKSMKLLSGIQKVPVSTTYETIEGQPDLRKEVVKYQFDDSGKQAIRAIALNEYTDDDGFANHVQSIVNDPTRRGRLEKVFEDNYGTKPSSLPDYAVAVKLDELQPAMIKSKSVADWPYRTSVNMANSMRKIAANKTPTSGGSGQGNLFNKIDLSKYGNPQQGRVDAVPAADLPADIPAVLKSAGIDVSNARDFQVEIDGGKIIAITPARGKRIDLVTMQNAQEKWNTQGQKQAQPDFQSKVPKVKQPTPTGKTSGKKVYKGLDKNGNPIFQ